MARATRSKGKTSRSSARSKGARGGRKPGKWEVVTPEEILAYRKAHGLSRAKLAELLEVSATSVQNWETGRVASRKIQHRLRALMDGQPPGPSGNNHAPPASGAPTAGQVAIVTTGEIVAAYLRTQKALKPEQLTQLVRSVKRALIA